MCRIKVFIIMFFVVSWSFAQDIPNARTAYDPARNPISEAFRGEIIEKEFSTSNIYSGTHRKYWIYIPRKYRPDKPACLYVSLDGISFDAPTVFDNLIETGDMPVTIGVFVTAGILSDSEGKPVRFNRSNEFDRTDDTFVRFLLEELLPDVEKQTTADGRGINISKDPNDRAIAGNSSGGICAFTAAWNRPDTFSRVFSAIGTYVPMRGGNEYPALIRKTEPKPIRIFLQDGDKDTWNPLFGSWFDANLNMQSALSFAGYEVAHAWGTGGHDGSYAYVIFPDVMRWLWKGWPNRVECNPSRNDMLETIIDDNYQWKNVELPFTPDKAIFSNREGVLFINDDKGALYAIDARLNKEKRLQLSSDERMLTCYGQSIYTANKSKIFLYDSSGLKKAIVNMSNVQGMIAVSPDKLYIAQILPNGERKLWLIGKDGKKLFLDTQKYGGAKLAISPNHQLLISSEMHSHWLYSFIIGELSLNSKQQWYWLHNMDNNDLNENGDMVFDQLGNLYVATPIGVQVCDHNGRVRAILSLPSGKISSLCFAGEKKNILYVLSGNKLLRRKLKVEGITPDMESVTVQTQGEG